MLPPGISDIIPQYQIMQTIFLLATKMTFIFCRDSRFRQKKTSIVESVNQWSHVVHKTKFVMKLLSSSMSTDDLESAIT
jgi:hypothetical protein